MIYLINMNKIIFTYLLTFIPAILILVDSVGYEKKVLTYLGVSSYIFMFLAWFILCIMNILKNKIFFNKKYYFLLILTFIFFFIITATLSIWAYFTPSNYVYSLTKLHQQQLGMLTFYLGICFLISKSKKWWGKNYKKVLIFFPFVMFFYLIIVRLWPFDYFYYLIKEDKIIENLQVAVLFVSGILILLRILMNKNKIHWKFFLFCIFLVITLFFIAGEEISWGQRIFNIKTPDKLTKINLQNEITLHNINSVQWLVEILYAFIGILGGLLWVIPKRFSRKHQVIDFFIPKCYLFGFFIMPGFYYSYPLYSQVNLFEEWAEIFELYIYIGISIHALQISTINKNVIKSQIHL